MPYDTLQWSIVPLSQDVHGEDAQGHDAVVGKSLYAAVTPIINGQAIETNWVFDTVALMVRQDIGYHVFDLFTCTCGVAGCAGIHDEIHLRVGLEEVQLQIPRVEPFIKRFVPKYFPSISEPFIWTFDAKTYHQSCADLIKQIQAIEASNPMTPVELWPDDERPSKTPIESVAIQLANAHKWSSEYKANINDSKAYLGPLYQAHMSIEIEESSYNLSVNSLFDSVGNTLFGVPPEDEVDEAADELRNQWLEEQTVYFRQHPQELIALFKSLPWESFQEHAYLFHADSARLTARLADSWPHVEAKLVTLERPEDQDWTTL